VPASIKAHATPDVSDLGSVEATFVLPTTLGLSPFTLGKPLDDSIYTATARVTHPDGSIETLTGTFDSVTQFVTLYAPGGTRVVLRIDMSQSSLKPTGQYYTLSGKVGSIAIQPRSGGQTTSTPLLYCGTFRGNSKGTFTMSAFDGILSGIASDGKNQLQIDGTLGSNGAANFTWVPEPNYLGRGIGTLTGTTMNGLWSLKNLLTGVFEENGDWTASNSCIK
jgi:hypothetical protein